MKKLVSMKAGDIFTLQLGKKQTSIQGPRKFYSTKVETSFEEKVQTLQHKFPVKWRGKVMEYMRDHDVNHIHAIIALSKGLDKVEPGILHTQDSQESSERQYRITGEKRGSSGSYDMIQIAYANPMMYELDDVFWVSGASWVHFTGKNDAKNF